MIDNKWEVIDKHLFEPFPKFSQQLQQHNITAARDHMPAYTQLTIDTLMTTSVCLSVLFSLANVRNEEVHAHCDEKWLV